MPTTGSASQCVPTPRPPSSTLIKRPSPASRTAPTTISRTTYWENASCWEGAHLGIMLTTPRGSACWSVTQACPYTKRRKRCSAWISVRSGSTECTRTRLPNTVRWTVRTAGTRTTRPGPVCNNAPRLPPTMLTLTRRPASTGAGRNSTSSPTTPTEHVSLSVPPLSSQTTSPADVS